ncbi:hypothetical protein ACFCYN_20575 [Gottfriedia sp. NPDC056225]|uniref:hypothetical protein n=1 Tax=Gottfriedia sp. NPDC056225 TaxID=3345751 RepID=UPI0035E2F462
MESSFIEIGKTRIALRDIKNYDITTEEVRKLWKVKKKGNIIFRIITQILLLFASPGDSPIPKEIEKSELVSYNVLVIRTFQGEVYEFSERAYDIDISQKSNELNKLLKLR